MSMPDIPQEWIKNYVDKLIRVAEDLPENGVMQNALMLRADTVLDMVVAFRVSVDGKDSNDPG